jgi:hypothetical protein
MTKEEIENSYVFKVVRRALMNELPYIKGVHVDETSIKDTYTVVFLTLDFDPFIFSLQYNIPFAKTWLNYLRLVDEDKTSVPGIFFKPEYREKVDLKLKEIEALVNDIQKSPVIPNEYKIEKKLIPLQYRVLKEYIPQDMRDIQ